MTLIDLYFIIGLSIIGIGGAELIWRCKPKEERERLLKEAREKEEERKYRRYHKKMLKRARDEEFLKDWYPS